MSCIPRLVIKVTSDNKNKMMISKKCCTKCRRTLKVYVTCYECHAIYHPRCLYKLSGFFVNEQGFMFCCGNIQGEKPIAQTAALIRNIKVEENETSGFCDFIHIFDSKVKMGIANRANKTVPKNILEVKELSPNNYGVFALTNIPECVYFGPYEGLEGLKCPNGTYVWRIRSGNPIDLNTEEYSNWMRYVNCADNTSIQNLSAFQYKKNIYYKALKEICAGEELVVSFQNGPVNVKFNVIEYFCPDIQEIKEDTYNCISCSYGFSNEKLLVSHKNICLYNKNELIEFNVYKEIFICTACKMEFSDVQLYAEHKSICMNYVCSNRKKLETGEISHKEENYQCPICNKSFTRKPNMLRHKESHDVTRRKNFFCPHCHKSFYRKGHLTFHVNEIHTQNKKYECSYCEFITFTSSSFKKHKLLNHDELIKKYKCHICPYVTLLSRELSYHIYRHSSKTEVMDLNDNKDNIQVLDKKLHEEKLTEKNNSAIENQLDLERHKTKQKEEEDHSMEENILQCFHCDYTTKIKHHLKKHIYIHMTDKPYKCEYENCSYQTCTSATLRHHVMGVHTFEKPYQCGYCDFKFVKKANLKIHIYQKHSTQILC